MGTPQIFQELCWSSPSLNALEDWSTFPPARLIWRDPALSTQRWLCRANQGTQSGDKHRICFKRALSPKPQHRHRQMHTHRAFLGKQEPREQVHNHCGVSVTPVGAQPSRNCQHHLNSKSLPQLHLVGDTRSQGPESTKGAEDDCAKSSHFRSCCLPGPQIQPMLEMSTPSWWVSDLANTETPLSYPWELSFHSLLYTPKPLFSFLPAANLFCKYNSNELIYRLQHLPIILKQSTQKTWDFLFNFHRQNILFASKMRSAETQKVPKSCHGLLVQLNWRHSWASEPFQGSGKCFASPLCSFFPAPGIHKFSPDGWKMQFTL